MAQRKTAGVFYGWYVVGSVCLSLFLGAGLFYAYGSFFTPLSQAFDSDRAVLAGPYAIGMAMSAGLGFITGPLADRFGPRVLVLAGGLLMGAGMILASRAEAMWQIYVAFGGGVGLGYACILVPGSEVVQHWFVRRRGVASGLAVMGVGVGNLVAPVVAAVLLRQFDWRTVFVVLGLAAGLGVVAAALLLVSTPEARGLRPDGDPAPAGAAAEPPPSGATLAEALGSRQFWLLYVALFASAVGAFFPFAQLVPDAESHGIHPVTASTILGLVGAGSITGRLVLGSAADRLGRGRTLAVSFVGLAVFLTWWLAADQVWSLAVFAIGFGLWYGSYFALAPALAADLFGARYAGTIIGVLYTALVPGALLGPPLAGAAYERYGSYALPITVSVVLMVIAAVCTFLLSDPRTPAAPAGGRIRPAAT